MAAKSNLKLVILLALIAGLGPMSIHVILPVLPAIKTAFGASNTVTQLTLTLGVVAMAVATIGYGPARRPLRASARSPFPDWFCLSWEAACASGLPASKC